MNSRFIALLLMLVVGLQSVLPLTAGAQPDTASSHCDDRGLHVEEGSQRNLVSEHPDCPHCADGSTAGHDCVSDCTALVAIVPATVSFAHEMSSSRAPPVPPVTFSRCDIPPTPPPIA